MTVRQPGISWSVGIVVATWALAGVAGLIFPLAVFSIAFPEGGIFPEEIGTGHCGLSGEPVAAFYWALGESLVSVAAGALALAYLSARVLRVDLGPLLVMILVVPVLAVLLGIGFCYWYGAALNCGGYD